MPQDNKQDGLEKFRLVLGKGEGLEKSSRFFPQEMRPTTLAKPKVSAELVAGSLKATAGSAQVIEQIPNLADWTIWLPTATFSVCGKTGTATYLDIWDADHFDGFTDMQRNLDECRVWFSAEGNTTWDSPQTKTGRVNCYFRAPTAGNYVCNVKLESYGGSAQVECLIDSFSFGPLSFNGTINQPHPSYLTAGYHSFRIRQMSGSYFFVNLTVWKV